MTLIFKMTMLLKMPSTDKSKEASLRSKYSFLYCDKNSSLDRRLLHSRQHGRTLQNVYRLAQKLKYTYLASIDIRTRP